MTLKFDGIKKSKDKTLAAFSLAWEKIPLTYKAQFLIDLELAEIDESLPLEQIEDQALALAINIYNKERGVKCQEE